MYRVQEFRPVAKYCAQFPVLDLPQPGQQHAKTNDQICPLPADECQFICKYKCFFATESCAADRSSRRLVNQVEAPRQGCLSGGRYETHPHRSVGRRLCRPCGGRTSGFRGSATGIAGCQERGQPGRAGSASSLASPQAPSSSPPLASSPLLQRLLLAALCLSRASLASSPSSPPLAAPSAAPALTSSASTRRAVHPIDRAPLLV